jgi:hypothetical protein
MLTRLHFSAQRSHPDEAAFFQDGLARFAQVEAVTKGANNGLGRYTSR